MAQHFWFGAWLDHAQLADKAAQLPDVVQAALDAPFPYDDFYQACERVAADLSTDSPLFDSLVAAVATDMDAQEARDMIRAMPSDLQKATLQKKLLSELGTARPGDLERRYPDRQFEAWYPVGLVTHVMPANVFLVAALGLVESLLAGNLNVVKLSARDSAFAALFAEALCQADPGGRLQQYVAVVHVSSSDQDLLQTFFDQSDAVSVWGGEKAVAAVRDMTGEGTRVIAWGHKISFNYFAEDLFADEAAYQQAIEGTMLDMCRLDQQACSSPQSLWVEGDRARLNQVAEDLAAALKAKAHTLPTKIPGLAEQAEITTVTTIAKAEQAFGVTQVWESDTDKSPWRLLLDERPGLTPSPLYRTLWIRPIERRQIPMLLRPMRAWLQSCGLACGQGSLTEVTRYLLGSGVTRIARPGEMMGGYQGAPHDGVYALQRFTRRVTVDAPAQLLAKSGVGRLAELETSPVERPAATPETPITGKPEFRALAEAFEQPDLVFRSGGSSGAPVWSKFTWDDYHLQMRFAAHGIVAAGLDPERDRVINLFAAGQMYGSFISFWTILETLRVPQLPMGIGDYYDEVIDVIQRFDATAMVAPPSFAIALFERGGERLKNGSLKKVFYGGELMTASQVAFLKAHGVTVVRSAAYGSNDIGPMGYQCWACEGTEHHLLSAAKSLEIVAMDSDEPVPEGEIGRLVFTPKDRIKPKIERYEIGDTGRWITEPCACGRTEPKFELTGRTGDFFKAGGPFLNYREFVRILEQRFDYIGPVQVQIHPSHQKNEIRVCLLDDAGLEAEAVRNRLVADYEVLSYMIEAGLGTEVSVALMPREQMDTVRASGKIRPVCDYR
ncbi:MAG: aldehyde dehydrogenase family protein [Hydrogenovibrio sp.]